MNNERSELFIEHYRCANMSFFNEINKYLMMDDEFEIDINFGLSMQCVWIMLLAICYGVFYFSVGIRELLYLMIFMFVCSAAMLAYCRGGGKHRSVVICLGAGAQSVLVHLLVTYYAGDSGTVFFVISSILIPHLYPLIKMSYTIALDVVLVGAINFAFWIAQNHTPVYADIIGSTYRFTLMNIGLTICMLELYVNIFSVNTLKTVRQRLVENASKDAFLDALTGLGNRRMLNRHLSSLETDADAPMCLAMIDIDFFKKINDTYGHAAGDKMLVFLADTMKSFFRKSDLLIRWGGEEFLIIFRFTEITNAEILMERFRSMIQDAAVAVDESRLGITVTIGLTEHSQDATIADSISKADELLYQGKREGRNRLVMNAQDAP